MYIVLVSVFPTFHNLYMYAKSHVCTYLDDIELACFRIFSKGNLFNDQLV